MMPTMPGMVSGQMTEDGGRRTRNGCEATAGLSKGGVDEVDFEDEAKRSCFRIGGGILETT